MEEEPAQAEEAKNDPQADAASPKKPDDRSASATETVLRPDDDDDLDAIWNGANSTQTESAALEPECASTWAIGGRLPVSCCNREWFREEWDATEM